MGRIAAGTVIARNYLAFARVIAESFHRFHPDTPFYTVIADSTGGCGENESFHAVKLDELGISATEIFRFRHTRQEVIIAAKPWLLQYLLDRGFSHVLFFDADILILDDLSELMETVVRHSMVLTPHISGPLGGEAGAKRELNILVSGVFNGGFVGMSDTPDSRSFLRWWQERLYTHCRHDVSNGMHYDQRWLDFAPALVSDLFVCDDPALNVAYWNLPERRLTVDGNGVRVGEAPCRFFHFSGFDPERREVVTRYWPSKRMSDTGPAAVLFERYADALYNRGHEAAFAYDWLWDRFDNGVEIPALARQIHAELGSAAEAHGDPICTAVENSFFEWLRQPMDAQTPPVGRIWQHVYLRRADLHAAFPDPLGTDRARFTQWILDFGVKEHGVPMALAPVIR